MKRLLLLLCTFLALDASAGCIPYWSPYEPQWFGPVPRGVIVAMDFSGDGVPDIASGAKTAVSLAITNRAAFSLGAPVTIATGEYFNGLAGADVDNDGKNDLVTTDLIANAIVVYPGNGDGTFDAPVTTPTTIAPTEITTGDFDGDGKIDVAFRSFSANALAIWKGDGAAHFTEASRTTIDTAARRLFAADFDGDTKLDLFVTRDATTTHALYRGNGDGTLQAAADVTGGNSSARIDAADLDGDHDVDVVTTEFATRTMTVLLNNGNGTFAAPAQQPVIPPYQYTYGDAFDIEIGDADGDTVPDVLLALTNDRSIATFLGAGDGTFRHYQRSVLIVDNEKVLAISLELFDVDGDGRNDVFYESGTRDRGVLVPNRCGDVTFHSSITPLISAGDVATVKLSLHVPSAYAEDDYPPTPTGTVTVYEGDTALVTVPYGWDLEFDVPGLTTLGTHELHVQYNGNDLYSVQRETKALQVTVTEATSSITLAANPAEPVYGSSLSLVATLNTPPGTSPTGSYRFFIDGVSTSVTSLAYHSAHLDAGTYQAHVRYLGDANTPPATSAPITFVVARKATTIYSYQGTSITTAGPAEIALWMPGVQGGTISLYEGNTLLGTSQTPSDADFTVNLPLGRHYLTAKYSGTKNQLPSELALVVEVVPSGPIALNVRVQGDALFVDYVANFSSSATYAIERRINGVWSLAYTEYAWPRTWTVPNPQPGVVYVFRVIARDYSGNVLGTSNTDAAMLASFTDDPLGLGVPVKALHVQELVSAIAAFRSGVGIVAATMPSVNSGEAVRTTHIIQLRDALNGARGVLGLAPFAFDDPTLSAGMPVRMKHLQQLRDAIR